MSRPRNPRDKAVPVIVSNEAAAVRPSHFRIAAALVWFCIFCLWFHSFGLPNNQPRLDALVYGDAQHEPHAQRWMVWKFLPFNLMDLIDPPTIPGEYPWSWFYLTQRLPFLGAALLVWLSAICVGRLALRWLRLCSLLDQAERLFYAGCLGLGAVSLLMLGLGLIGAMSVWPLVLILFAAAIVEAWLTKRDGVLHGAQKSVLNSTGIESGDVSSKGWSRWIVPIIVAPFVCCLLLGAMSPQFDFDVIEYHLGGPKEWFLQGRITRLPHNVYTSFPFLTEMLLLTGMVVGGDWEWGALVGQAIQAGFAPLTAIGLFATGRRWFSNAAGWMAVLIWLTTPWVYRISIIAYAEGGLACYLFAAFAMGLRFAWFHREPGTSPSGDAGDPPDMAKSLASPLNLAFCSGILSGCAMSCKYTGLYSVVFPVGILLLVSVMRQAAIPESARRVLLVGGIFGLGVVVSVGPWLVKNLVETGNPVFPLAYSLFDGAGRDATMDAQWQMAHSRHYRNAFEILKDLPVKLTDVVANNDWHSALMFGLAPVALLASWRRKVWVVWTMIGWQFFSWFLLTHQIDRFYVPMFPLVALLAGCGAGWLISSSFVAAWIAGGLMAVNIVFNAWLMEQPEMSGFNAGRMDLRAARQIVVAPGLEWLNFEYTTRRLPAGTKILCVGEAALFHAKFPYVYNTVFDRSLFEEWFGERTESGGFRLRPPTQIRATLRERGITHVLVNWSEILRYREPGSYGYTDFAHPDRFRELQAAGILGLALPLPDQGSFVPVDEKKREQIKTWAPSLAITIAERPGYRSLQVFPVQP